MILVKYLTFPKWYYSGTTILTPTLFRNNKIVLKADGGNKEKQSKNQKGKAEKKEAKKPSEARQEITQNSFILFRNNKIVFKADGGNKKKPVKDQKEKSTKERSKETERSEAINKTKHFHLISEQEISYQSW